ncbi:FecCD family ABC transporter permease [Marinobacter sp. JSM 1782161]|uniref:FecCD family ABC transporter permease n=1 Tax=Marinobacter sp. JSM 1782161 TaxID=2685906 RepID=UPI001403F31E|nr:iron ABC transporter permease [Marinobacter sp. JSM 1782161]
MRHSTIWLPTLLLLNLLVFGLALGWGSIAIDPLQVFAGDLPDWQSTIVMELRLPRAVTAFAVGGMLALAGVLMQVLLRNPLAEPYVLGISGGAAVAALGAITLGLGGWWVSGSAFVGSLASMLLVFLLGGRMGYGRGDRLLLTGVVIAAGWGACISLLLVLGPDQSLRGMLFWLMGELSRPETPWWALLVLALALAAAWFMAPALDLLARGDEQAAVLGVETRRLRGVCYLTASFLTACAVTLAGPVGFVGLVVPHLMRQWLGAGHRALAPASLLAGGALLMLADTAARSLIAPRQLPVGVLTAAVGVPLFLYLLQRRGTR